MNFEISINASYKKNYNEGTKNKNNKKQRN